MVKLHMPRLTGAPPRESDEQGAAPLEDRLGDTVGCVLRGGRLEPALDAPVEAIVTAALEVRLVRSVFDDPVNDLNNGWRRRRWRPPSAISRADRKSFQVAANTSCAAPLAKPKAEKVSAAARRA